MKFLVTRTSGSWDGEEREFLTLEDLVAFVRADECGLGILIPDSPILDEDLPVLELYDDWRES